MQQGCCRIGSSWKQVSEVLDEYHCSLQFLQAVGFQNLATAAGICHEQCVRSQSLICTDLNLLNVHATQSQCIRKLVQKADRIITANVQHRCRFVSIVVDPHIQRRWSSGSDRCPFERIGHTFGKTTLSLIGTAGLSHQDQVNQIRFVSFPDLRQDDIQL